MLGRMFKIILGLTWVVIGGIAGVSWILFCFSSVLGVILILIFAPPLLFLPFGLSIYGFAVISQGLTSDDKGGDDLINSPPELTTELSRQATINLNELTSSRESNTRYLTVTENKPEVKIKEAKKILKENGYKVYKTEFGWLIVGELGGRMKFTNVEELYQYALPRKA